MTQTKNPHSDRSPSDAEKRAQGERCGCQGADDMCQCQNLVLQPPDCRAVAILTAKEKANDRDQ